MFSWFSVGLTGGAARGSRRGSACHADEAWASATMASRIAARPQSRATNGQPERHGDPGAGYGIIGEFFNPSPQSCGLSGPMGKAIGMPDWAVEA
jgi:hypothetical protein